MAYRHPSRKTEKGRSREQPFPEFLGLERPEEGCLAKITPSHHNNTQTLFEYQILMRHWITSFALVEHERNVRLDLALVQSSGSHNFREEISA
jgi:hypothetical protein